MNILIKIITRYRIAFMLLWLSILSVSALVVIFRLYQGVKFESSILALLPKESANPFQKAVDKRLQALYENKIVYLVEVGNDARENAYQQFKASLNTDFSLSPGFAKVQSPEKMIQIYQQLKQQFLSYRYVLLDSNNQKLIEKGESESLVGKRLAQLLSPIPGGGQTSFTEDPLGVFEDWLQSRFSAEFNFDPESLEPIYAYQEKKYKASIINIEGDAFSLANQETLQAILIKAESALLEKGQARYRSGLIFHALHGATQARKEVATIGFVSIFVLLVLLIYAYKSVVPVLLTAMALLGACTVALAVSLLVFDNLHMITLAFGASLIGVSVDYCFHFFSARPVCSSPRTSVEKIFPAIVLGLLSSVFAYGLQATTPFPGLKQLAVFSVTGLIASWLSVVLLFPFIDRRKKPKARVSSVGFIIEKKANSSRFVALGAALCLALGAVFFLDVNDDIRLLQNSPDALLEQEKKVKDIMGQSSAGSYFVVYSSDGEILLEKEKALLLALDTLVAKGEIGSYEAISNYVPSRVLQEKNYQLQDKHLYSSDGAISRLLARLGLPQQAMEPFVNNFVAARGKYFDLQVLQQNVSMLDQSPLAGLYLGELETEDASIQVSIVRLENPGGSVKSMATLPAELGLSDNVYFVDKVSYVSAVLKEYRTKMQTLAVVAIAAICFGLWLRYGKQLVHIVAPVLMSISVLLVSFALLGLPLNLFSVLGFMLLLGVGLDIGLFLYESSFEAHAWQAVSLSAMTTMLAFGLLAFSQTPVLHFFGVVVLPGIAFTWLFTWLLVRVGPGRKIIKKPGTVEE